jgi:hypothetical protein
MADAADSKSADRKVVKVRLLSPAPDISRYIRFFTFSNDTPAQNLFSCCLNRFNITSP